MAKITKQFAKFMIDYVEVLNDLRLSIIEASESVGTATSGGKTIPQRAADLITMDEAVILINDAKAAAGDPVLVYISETSGAGLAPGIITPINGVISTRKLAFEETAYTTANPWTTVYAEQDSLFYSTLPPTQLFPWYELGVALKFIAYEGGRYREFPGDNTTPLTDAKVASVTTIPIGVSVYYPSVSVPYGFLVEDGRALSKTEYPELYAALGDTWGETSTTFNIPNKLGMFCIESTPGVRNTSVTAPYDHTHAPSISAATVRTDQSPHIDYRPTETTGTAVIGHYVTNTFTLALRSFTATGPSPTTENPVVRTSTHENRPKNISIVSCIKAKY